MTSENTKPVFCSSALNLTIDNIEELKQALLEAVRTYEAIPDKANSYGQKYIIDFPLTRNNKTAIVHSVWIVRNNENFPRKLTCYLL
jgi:hypothetical protein